MEVAGANQWFSKCRGGLSFGCYNPLKQITLNLAIVHLYIIQFQSLGGARANLEGANAPPPRPKCSPVVIQKLLIIRLYIPPKLYTYAHKHIIHPCVHGS